MSKNVTLLFTLLFLSNIASAAISVQDLYDLEKQNAAAMEQMRNDFSTFKTDLNDRINTIKITEVLSFALIYISLNCFAYLFHVAWNYRRREKIMRERDKFVDNLKTANQLMIERISLMDKNQQILEKELSERLIPKRKPLPLWLSPVGGLITLLGVLIFYYSDYDWLFIIGMGFPIVAIGILTLERRKKPEPETILEKVEEEIKEDNKLPEAMKEEV